MARTSHNKETVVREYCLARRIPYHILSPNAQLNIGKGNNRDTVFCIYNIPWAELISTIDNMVEYDEYGYFVNVKERV